MNRRNFIKSGLAAMVSAGLLARVPLAANDPAVLNVSIKMTDKDFLEFVNYTIHTRIMPKYQTPWQGREKVLSRVEDYMRKLGEGKVMRYEKIILRNEVIA